MARYRKVDPRIWNDAKFRSLSDNAKLVFFMLLTHPNMTALGAMRGTVAGLAAEIGWKSEAFGEAFGEVIAKGMAKHDPQACFVGLPNFIRYNEPESPNVVKAWVGALDLLPECAQRNEVVASAVAYVRTKGKAFSEAFAEAFPEAFPEGRPKPMPNQEQEQEQEQEQKGGEVMQQSALSPSPAVSKKPKREQITLETYLSECKAAGRKAVPEDHHVRRWAADAGISDEMLQIAWVKFRERYTEGETGCAKRYKDWPAHFATAVKDNWFQVWIIGDGGIQWANSGLIYRTVLEARMRSALEKAQEVGDA